MEEKRREKGKTEKLEFVPEERKLPEPEVWTVNKQAWSRPGVRVGFISGVDYKSEGYRKGLIRRAFEKFLEEGTHFNIFDGGLIDKKDIKRRIKDLLSNYPRESNDRILDHFLNESARELSSAIPKIRKPRPEKGYIRLYISTSLPYDGPWGEEIARRLQALRPEDIRHYKQGGDRFEIKHSESEQDGERNKVIWAINPRKQRLASKYYSTAAEREIDDKRGQTTQLMPDLWAVAPFASSIHKPRGERDEPYITTPACRRLEEVTVAENQIGVAIVEYTLAGDRLVRVWSFKDLVAREREFIPFKDGCSDTQKGIIKTMKQSGSQTIGLLADALEIKNRKIIEKEIKGLIKPDKNWPGLTYDSSSQRYNFNPSWIQEELRYLPNKDGYIEDRVLFFGCLHAGTITTDYQFFVEEMPKIILNYGVNTLVDLGDSIAGLKYDYLKTGEVFGNLNNTDQEKFAAEIIGTAIIKVFKRRLEGQLVKPSKKSFSIEEAKKIIEECLITFIYIPGNHDLWQEMGGTIPLVVFRDKLVNLLIKSINETIIAARFPTLDFSSLSEIVNRKVIGFPDFDAVYVLPSGLKMGMRHPHQARADTTSLRAQHGLDRSESGCQIEATANFHTTIVINKWYPDRGQCVGIQTGTFLLYTRFERRKTKRIDFGPVLLRTLSKNGRIEMSESAYFNTPILEEPLIKWTNLDQLKEKLGILSTP